VSKLIKKNYLKELKNWSIPVLNMLDPAKCNDLLSKKYNTACFTTTQALV
jgi:hypothetical protein